MRVTRVDQIAIVVDDLDSAVAHYAAWYGLAPSYREVLDDAGIEEAMIDIGGVWLQLIAPTRSDSTVSDFLREHGAGLHHLGFGVASIRAALEDLKAEGAEIRQPAPRVGGGGHLVAFIEPEPITGVLTELVEDAH